MKVITSFDKMEKILIEDLSEDKSTSGSKVKVFPFSFFKSLSYVKERGKEGRKEGKMKMEELLL